MTLSNIFPAVTSTFTDDLDLQTWPIQHEGEAPCQRSCSLKIIFLQKHRHTHVYLTDYSAWTTKVVGENDSRRVMEGQDSSWKCLKTDENETYLMVSESRSVPLITANSLSCSRIQSFSSSGMLIASSMIFFIYTGQKHTQHTSTPSSTGLGSAHKQSDGASMYDSSWPCPVHNISLCYSPALR